MKRFAQIPKKKLCWGISAFIFILWILFKCHSGLKKEVTRSSFVAPEAQARSKDVALVAVRAIKVEKQPWREQIPVQGIVTGNKIQLRFEMSGMIKDLPLQQGKTVKKGELLATLDEEDAKLKIQYRQAKCEAAFSQLQAAQNKVALYEELSKTGYLLPAKLEEIRLEKENREKEVTAARFEVESAHREYEKHFLYAPCDGIVSEQETAVGEYVPSGTLIGTFVDLGDLWLELNVTEGYVGKVKPGQKVKLSSRLLGEKEILGIVESVVPVIQGKSRTLKTKVKIQEGKKDLVPGLFVKGEVEVYEKPETVMLSQSCIQHQDGEPYVPVVDPQNKVEFRGVQLGFASQAQVEILAGLEVGESVIVESQRPLKPGEVVRVLYEDR